MSWVFDNLQIIIIVASVVAYWLNQRRREKAGEEADYDGDGIPENRPVRRKIDPKQPDPEEAERARRIQEEIRRKIAERSGRAPQSSPPVATHRPTMQRPAHHEPPPVPTQPRQRPQWPRPTEAPTPAAPGPLPDVLRRLLDPHGEIEAQARERAEAAERAARDRMRALQEDLDRAQERQRAEAERAAAFRRSMNEIESASAPNRAPAGSILESLRDPDGVKRAIVLREVLGPPVGLR